jgi:hypothetical protein
MCPWCLKYTIHFNEYKKINCEKCGYGIRHGICTEENSLYKKIFKKYKNIQVN